MISLKKRFMLTYALFISLSLLIVTITINHFTVRLFEEMAREAKTERSDQIVRSIAELYNPRRGFNMMALSAMGSHFINEGYIISIENSRGNTLWSARSSYRNRCNMVINDISERMRNHHQIVGEIQYRDFPLTNNEILIGNVKIETLGPFFYSESQSRFLNSMNSFLVIAGIVCAVISILISVILARALAEPILKAGKAARLIAEGNRNISISENYKTKELHELAKSINILAYKLAEGERRQKQLAADIAHELRTPLTCLQGNLEAMLDGVMDVTPERLASCHEEIVRISKLVQDINLLTKLESEQPKLYKSYFDLATLLQTVAEQFEQSARDKHIVLEKSFVSIQVFADYDRLKQVFINLLSNAVKYTDKGIITLAVSPVTDTSACEITVADTGIGMSKEDISRVFERFYRSDKSRNRNTGGAGIGLTIAATIITAHGGNIKAESELGKGSMFHITIPLEIPSDIPSGEE